MNKGNAAFENGDQWRSVVKLFVFDTRWLVSWYPERLSFHWDGICCV